MVVERAPALQRKKRGQMEFLLGRYQPNDGVFGWRGPLSQRTHLVAIAVTTAPPPDPPAAAKCRRVTQGYPLPLDCLQCLHRLAWFVTCPTPLESMSTPLPEVPYYSRNDARTKGSRSSYPSYSTDQTSERCRTNGCNK